MPLVNIVYLSKIGIVNADIYNNISLHTTWRFGRDSEGSHSASQWPDGIWLTFIIHIYSYSMRKVWTESYVKESSKLIINACGLSNKKNYRKLLWSKVAFSSTIIPTYSITKIKWTKASPISKSKDTTNIYQYEWVQRNTSPMFLCMQEVVCAHMHDRGEGWKYVEIIQNVFQQNWA